MYDESYGSTVTTQSGSSHVVNQIMELCIVNSSGMMETLVMWTRVAQFMYVRGPCSFYLHCSVWKGSSRGCLTRFHSEAG